MSKARLLSFWEGPVTWVERLCVASMLQQGHELTIYTFDPEALRRCNLGAEIRHVSEVLSEKHIAHRYYAAGESSHFSDLFRLELQLQGKGTWADLDCYLIKPLMPKSEYVFGVASPGKLNGAILRLPSDCPMILDYSASVTADPFRLPWASFRRRLRRELEILIGQSQPHPSSVGGSLGPRALTYFVNKHNLLKYAAPQEAYYPIAIKDVPLLFDPDPKGAAAKLTAGTTLIHLWRSRVVTLGWLTRLPPATSYLGTACAEQGVTVAA
jgi:hypothetical protein